MDLLTLAKAKEPAFTGFDNWKKAIKSFDNHQHTDTHQLAVSQLSAVMKPTVTALLDDNVNHQQEVARKSLHKICTLIQFLLGQGLAFRGHNADEGNLMQLLKLRAEDDDDLRKYLMRKPTSYHHRPNKK